MGMAFLPGLGLFGTVFAARKRKLLTHKRVAWTAILGLLLLVSMFALGCGSNSKGQTPVSQTNVMVTGTSGAITHTAALSITVN
jgi:hypothetical protein